MRSDIAQRLEDAKALAGGNQVRPHPVNDIEGLTVVLVVPGGPQPHDKDGTSAAVLLDGGRSLLRSKAAMREVIKRSKDPVALAQLALGLLENHPNSVPITDPSGARAPKDVASMVSAPALDDDTLVFWAWTGSPGRSLQRRTLDLATLDLEVISGQSLVRKALGPLAALKKDLATSNQSILRSAIDELGRRCNEIDGAADLLLETMRAHSSAFARIEAGKRVRKCRKDGTTETLIQILAHDSDDQVRMWAAIILGDIADPAARPALESAAANTRDRRLKSAANQALKKLK